jgi:hypothetical protein
MLGKLNTQHDRGIDLIPHPVQNSTENRSKILISDNLKMLKENLGKILQDISIGNDSE